jgi:hypothetical protein
MALSSKRELIQAIRKGYRRSSKPHVELYSMLDRAINI